SDYADERRTRLQANVTTGCFGELRSGSALRIAVEHTRKRLGTRRLNGRTLRLGKVHRRSVLDRVAGRRPRIDAADQRTYASVALFHQQVRRAARRLLVGTRAIQHDVAIFREIVDTRDRIEIEQLRTWDMRTRSMRKRAADVDDEGPRVDLESSAELVDGDDRRREKARQAPALHSLERHVGGGNRHRHQYRHGEVPFHPRERNLDLPCEYVPRDHRSANPQ